MRLTKISATSLRGYIYEAAIDKMFQNAGFTKAPNTYQNPRVKVKGRAVNNQIDCIKLFPIFIPFTYPLRLLVEVKGWGWSVGSSPLMKFKSVLDDIAEFGNREYKSSDEERILNFGDQLIERFVDIPVFISLNGFKQPAQEYGMLNGVCLVDHSKTPEMIKLTEKIRKMIEAIPSFSYKITRRDLALAILTDDHELPDQLKTNENFMEQRKEVLDNITSVFSIFGSVDGRVPVHILTNEELPTVDDGSQISANIEKNNGVFTLLLYQSNQKVFTGHFTLPSLYDKYIQISGRITNGRKAKARPLQNIVLFYKKGNRDVFLKANINEVRK